MIAHFKNLVECKINFRKSSIPRTLVLAGVILALLTALAPAGRGETEDVKVIERRPDASNPLYEDVKVEGGLMFHVPKGMTFVKKDGLINVMSTEEYCATKFEALSKKIDALSARVGVLERGSGVGSSEKN